MIDNQDDQQMTDPAPRWWNIMALGALAVLALVFLGGCVNTLPPDPDAAIARVNAESAARQSMWESIGRMPDPTAQAAVGIVFIMTDKGAQSDYGHYADANKAQNKAQEKT